MPSPGPAGSRDWHSTTRHPLAAALAAETGRGKRPTQNSPGGWAAAPSRPFSSSQRRSGCHFETSGAVPLRPGPQGHSTDGRMREDTPSLDHTSSMKSPTFTAWGPHSRSGAEGPHPPYTVQPPTLLQGPPSPNPETSPKSGCHWAPHLLPVGGWIGTTIGPTVCKSPPQVPTHICHPNSSTSWSTTPSSKGLKIQLPAFRPRRGAGSPSADLLGPPARAAICRLSHHFHFPPPLKQPPSSLALKAPQPELLHTPSYSPHLPSPAQTGLRNRETDSQRYLLGKPRPGPLPQPDQWSLSPAPWGSGPSPPSLAHQCRRGGGLWGRRECGRGLKGGGAAGLRSDACREGPAGPDARGRGL